MPLPAACTTTVSPALTRPRDEHVPGRREHDLAGGGLFEAQLGGHHVGAARRRQHLLGVAAEQLDAEHPRGAAEIRAPLAAERTVAALDLVLGPDTIAGLEALDAGADRLDDAGELDPELVRQRQRPARDPGAQVDVEVVHPARAHRDHDLARSRDRVRHVLVAQHLGRPVFVVADGLHRRQITYKMRVTGRARARPPSNLRRRPAADP
jgi:hypothetical protein